MKIRGEDPVIDLKYDLLKHPNVKYTTDGGGPIFIHGEERGSKVTISLVGDDIEARNRAIDIEEFLEKTEMAEMPEFIVRSYEEFE